MRTFIFNHMCARRKNSGSREESKIIYGLLRIFTVTFLVFLPPAGISNSAGYSLILE